MLQDNGVPVTYHKKVGPNYFHINRMGRAKKTQRENKSEI